MVNWIFIFESKSFLNCTFLRPIVRIATDMATPILFISKKVSYCPNPTDQ